MKITDFDAVIEALEDAISDYDFNFDYEEKDGGLEACISEEYLFDKEYSYATLYVNIYDCGEMLIECFFGNTPKTAEVCRLLADLNAEIYGEKAYLSDEIDGQDTFTISLRIAELSSYGDIYFNLKYFLQDIVQENVKDCIRKICALEITEN